MFAMLSNFVAWFGGLGSGAWVIGGLALVVLFLFSGSGAPAEERSPDNAEWQVDSEETCRREEMIERQREFSRELAAEEMEDRTEFEEDDDEPQFRV